MSGMAAVKYERVTASYRMAAQAGACTGRRLMPLPTHRTPLDGQIPHGCRRSYCASRRPSKLAVGSQPALPTAIIPDCPRIRIQPYQFGLDASSDTSPGTCILSEPLSPADKEGPQRVNLASHVHAVSSLAQNVGCQGVHVWIIA